MTLAEFLLARVAEDESIAGACHRLWCAVVAGPTADGTGPCDCDLPEQMRRECEAKRRIVEEHEIGIDPCDAHDGYTMRSVPCDTVLALAAVYADHADFQEGWRV